MNLSTVTEVIRVAKTQRLCNPDARGVQLEAFAGLDPNGDKRSGMHRGSGLAADTS